SCRQQPLVGLPALHRHRVGGLAVLSVVDECPDRNARSELWSASDVVVMKMGDKDVFFFLDPSFSSASHNPVRVTAFVPRPAGVDQQRLPGRSDEQSSLAAFDIDEVYVQGFVSRTRRRPGCDPQSET